MEILAILEVLEDLIEKSLSVPLSGKCIVDREEILEIIKVARLKLPDDLKQAKWIKEERHRILLEAQQESNNLVSEAEKKLASIVDEHHITKAAHERANEIIANAQKNARDIRLGTKAYADDILNQVEGSLRQMMDVVINNRDELKQ